MLDLWPPPAFFGLRLKVLDKKKLHDTRSSTVPKIAILVSAKLVFLFATFNLNPLTMK